MFSRSAAASDGSPRSASSSPLVSPPQPSRLRSRYLLFRLIGPSRTRLVAQILAAIIGAGFVIALQVAAILSYGTLSRFAVLTSDAAADYAPALDSPLWWPARAAIGDGVVLSLLLAGGLVLLGVVMAIFSPRFADTVVSVAATARSVHRGPARDRVSRRFAAAGLARQGVPAAAARPVADVAEPDATALSGAAGPDAVAKFFGKLGRDRADHARDRDGGGTARRRPRLADDFGRGRRRPGRDRAAAAVARHPRQDRSGADRRSPRSSRR